MLLFGGLDGEFLEGLEISLSGVGSVAYEYLRSEVFATIPLFMLLGDFVKRSGAARDLYNLGQTGPAGHPGASGHCNRGRQCDFCRGHRVSLAARRPSADRLSADAPSRVQQKICLGVGGGQRLPWNDYSPSVLLIVWGIIAEKSIAQLFIAGAIPGILLAGLFMVYIGVSAVMRPIWLQRCMRVPTRRR